MLMDPALAGGRKSEKRRKKKKRERDGEVEGEEACGGDQGMDVFTLYPLFF
jgi:hypothetical protein